uniref:60S ribosomal protein L34 n=3 Tax=Solanum tuberosum TaxID=4113 RepID=M1D398_SOLTU
MTWFLTSLWGFFCWFVFKIYFFLENRRVVDENDEMDCKNQKRLDFDEKGVEKESSFLVQSKYEFISGKDSFGFMEKPEVKSFSVEEMFVNVNEGDEEEKEIDKNSDDKLFYFSFFKNGSVYQEKSEFFDEKNVNDQEKLEFFDEKGEEHVDNHCFEEILKKNDEFSSDEETQDSEDICYEIQLLPENESLIRNSIRGSEGIGDELCSDRHLHGFLKSDQFMGGDREENDDMGFIELETSLHSSSSSIGKGDFDAKNIDGVEVADVKCEEMKLMNDFQKSVDHNSSRKSWDINVFSSQNVDRVVETDVNCEEMKLMEDIQESPDHNSSRNSLDMDGFASQNVDRVEGTTVNYEEMKLMDDIQESPDHNSSRNSLDMDGFASQNVDRVEGTNVNYEEMKIMDDFQESPNHNSSRKSWDTDGFASQNVDRIEETDVNYEEMDDFQDSPDHNSSRKLWDTDSDSDDDDDILLEHQNLVRQMKMEMKNSRITGLPTISEDYESPKVVEDLKPLKIDEKIGYKYCIEEIQKFYKSYAEKMRKLDILNYQTLNAISFLQLKDSEMFMSRKKTSISITKAFALPSFLANKQRKIFADPAQKSISEMNIDLEIVYVGQICLSWEILYWQYGKAKDLLEHDPHEYHTYNQVAGEYQQFQVLLQRFVEDEPFQGPRVQNYVRKRCILRSFLQVPSIRDDRFKGKKGEREEEKDVISIVKLGEVIKETMQVFWEFLCADKREANLALKGVQRTQMDNAEIELFMNVKLDLQKKERKLKDVQRSGNCIVKKFQKQQERRLSHSLFASLVELKLVSRVLSLPRLRRDYLIWCQRKLSNINVAGRKVSMEQSFSLFPC